MDHFVGIDVGGTKIAVAGLARGELGESHLMHTELADQERLLDQLASGIELARTADTRAVGIGVPSLVEFATGRIASSVNIPLADVPLRRLLSERAGLPVFVDNDASCAALAEAFEDGRMTCAHLVMFTVGTGVGGGLVLNGRVYRGAVGMAAEVGHTIIGLDLEHGASEPSGRFPQEGSLEALAAGRALDQLALDAAREDANSFLGQRLTRDGGVTGHDVVDGARLGDAASVRCLEILGQRLGIGIANAINTFDPQEVVIGGGVSAAGELLLRPARECALRHVVPGLGTETRIRLARHGPRAGVLGAALMAAQEWAEEHAGRAGAAVATASEPVMSLEREAQ
jgi:glucokinase